MATINRTGGRQNGLKPGDEVQMGGGCRAEHTATLTEINWYQKRIVQTRLEDFKRAHWVPRRSQRITTYTVSVALTKKLKKSVNA